MGTKQYMQLLKKYFHIPDRHCLCIWHFNLDALNEDMVEDIPYHITQMHLLEIWKRISPSIFEGAKYINDDGNPEVLFQ